jgi:hypothetical protein
MATPVLQRARQPATFVVTQYDDVYTRQKRQDGGGFTEPTTVPRQRNGVTWYHTPATILQRVNISY